jgi:hypothetical protein
LFALHLTFISFSLAAVSFTLEGLAAGAVAAGAAVWAEAASQLPATSSRAATQTLIRSMEIPLNSLID